MNKTLNSLPRRQMLAGSASALAAAGLATFTRGAAAAGETPVASATPKPLPACATPVSSGMKAHTRSPKAIKAQQGVIDFADAEWLACRLLASEEHAPGLAQKLDARYRHLLLDEFQDTSKSDIAILMQLIEQVDPDSLRADKLAAALENFTLTVDFEQDAQARIRDYKKARALLAPLLKAKNGSTVPVFYAVGNAHLDLAWL